MKGPWPPWADRDRQALCACGCGQPAPVARKTSTANRVRAGQQLRYVHGHNTRTRGAAMPMSIHVTDDLGQVVATHHQPLTPAQQAEVQAGRVWPIVRDAIHQLGQPAARCRCIHGRHP